MKILKIELQNINSLKSNQPIVIDFESDEFKDVGLFAITGPTGAGKSTILDAITIALYRKIPRFNNSKGSLIDVVSFGASNAFSRITFLNNNEIFEASWHIRVANSSGKKLKKPSEEVRLKNLTNKKIISNKLNTIAKEVENVTQLNYGQFLRSVMLAQGEFASFLSAKGPKKGELLEQITGEDIYKKIGQKILDRQREEIKKLEQLNSKINNDDILSEEDKIAFKKQEKEINEELKSIENQLKLIEKITNWYANFNQFQIENKQLDLNAEQLNQEIKKHQNELNRLLLHQKAEPFKELILNINRIEKSNQLYTQSIKETNKELTTIKPKLISLIEKEKNNNEQLKSADSLFNEWLPKFDKISALDSNIKNLKKDLENTKDEIEKNNNLKNNLITKNIELNKELKSIDIELKNSKNWMEKNHFLLEVNAILPQWISDLTTLKNTIHQLKENKKLLQEKTEQLTQTSSLLSEKNKKITQETKNLKDINVKIIEIDEKIKTHQLKDVNLNEKKDQLNTQLNTLNQLKNLSESFIKTSNKIDELKQKNTTNKQLLKDKQQHLTHLLKQIDKQNELIKSNEDNLKLKRSIKNYEQDRKELVEGKECPLCGSKEHPFTSHLKAFNLSDDEQKLNLLKKELSELELNKNKLNNEITVINTKFDANTEEINQLTTQINDIKQSKKELNIDIDLSNTIKINTQINLLNQQIKDVNEKIEFKAKLQEQKDNFKQSFDIQKEKVDKLNIEIAALTQKKEIIEKNLKNLTDTINHLTNEESKKQQQLTKELSEFNYQLPNIEKVDAFIVSVKNNISTFQKTNENLSNLQHKIAQIKTNIKHNNTAINEKEQLVKNKTELLKTIESNLKKIQNQRASLLPFDVSVEDKRKELNDNKNTISKKLKEITDEIKTLEQQKNKQQTLLKKFQTDLEKAKKELDQFNTQLQQQLISSDFDSKQSVKDAILSDNDYQDLKKLQDNFNKKQIEINTLKSKNKNQTEQLLKQKDFNVSEEESTEQLNQLKQKNKELIGYKGEIKEKFRKDEDIKKRNQLIYNQIKEQEKICNVWRDLFKIIGNSKDAFNTYVQRLTLKQLLGLANVHLYRLNKRYSLKMQDNYKPKEELNFNLIDHYQTDQARLVDTSSGGEKFIISLALALGLSDLASKNVKIDSLFIDEGFGTLDSNALETVISTLETLQSQGKMIGIISHVENLKERITRQIKINKKSNGVSSVEIV